MHTVRYSSPHCELSGSVLFPFADEKSGALPHVHPRDAAIYNALLCDFVPLPLPDTQIHVIYTHTHTHARNIFSSDGVGYVHH